MCSLKFPMIHYILADIVYGIKLIGIFNSLHYVWGFKIMI